MTTLVRSPWQADVLLLLVTLVAAAGWIYTALLINRWYGVRQMLWRWLPR